MNPDPNALQELSISLAEIAAQHPALTAILLTNIAGKALNLLIQNYYWSHGAHTDQRPELIENSKPLNSDLNTVHERLQTGQISGKEKIQAAISEMELIESLASAHPQGFNVGIVAQDFTLKYFDKSSRQFTEEEYKGLQQQDVTPKLELRENEWRYNHEQITFGTKFAYALTYTAGIGITLPWEAAKYAGRWAFNTAVAKMFPYPGANSQ